MGFKLCRKNNTIRLLFCGVVRANQTSTVLLVRFDIEMIKLMQNETIKWRLPLKQQLFQVKKKNYLKC